jgi:transposase-like protein
MARTQYSVEFKLRVVRETEEVGSSAEVARRYELHPNVVYRWLGAYRRDGEAAFGRKIRRASHGVPVDTARMREVESENERLKRILGEKELEIAILRDLLKKGADPHRKVDRG